MEVMRNLAKPYTDKQAVLVSGATRTGKSQVVNKLYVTLPKVTVVKTKEAAEKDIYKMGTKLGPKTVLVLLDDFEVITPMTESKNIWNPNYQSQEVRTGCSRGGTTHTDLPVALKWFVPSQLQWPMLFEVFRKAGASVEDVEALQKRLDIIDLYNQDVKTHTHTRTHTHTHTNTHTHTHTHAHTDTQTHKHTHKQTIKQTYIQTYNHTNGQANRPTNRHTQKDIQTNNQTEIQTNRHTHVQTNKQTDKQKERQTNRQTNRQTDMHTDKHTHIQTH